MIKKQLLLLLLAVISLKGNAQGQNAAATPPTPMIDFDGYMFNDLTHIKESVQFGVMDTRVFDVFTQNKPPNYDEFKKAHPEYTWRPFIAKSPLLLGVRISGGHAVSTYQVNMLSKSYIARILPEGTSVTLLAMGITTSNVRNYRYHVVENDSAEIVPWTTPQLQQQYGARQPYGFLGSFKSHGKQLMVEVVNIKDYSIRDGMIFNWNADVKAPQINHLLAQQHRKPYSYIDLLDSKGNSSYASRFDERTNLPADLHFPLDSLNSLSFCFKNHPGIPYDIYWKRVSSNNNPDDKNLIAYHVTDSVYRLDNQYFQAPGKFEVWICPADMQHSSKVIRFEFGVTQTKSSLNQIFTLRQIIPFLLLALLLFSIYYLFNKRRLRKIEQQRTAANLKLSTVRAQLNPHFMFNALTSIQNLMNQQDSAGANHYLSKFAGLTRQVLNASRRELISLEDELQIITDYLQMEQLRFGFSYNIHVDAGINQANAEIPTMLLQPFIENAAKHGVSALQALGRIEVDIIRQKNNMVLTVTDNGPGFDAGTSNNDSMGLKISEERIALLNQLYKDQPITLQINTGKNGTKITITLTNWL